MSCLTENTVDEFVAGHMKADEAAAVDRHMAECSACRSWVVDVAKMTFDDGTSAPDPDSPKVGDVVGRYRLVEVLGVGGMGMVFAADDPELGRRIALKLIRTDLAHTSGSDLTRRLHREARAMARISHPNVVTVHDIGTIGDHLFVGMEYVHGSTLRAWCAEHARTWIEILDVFLAAGRGLVAAHAVGLVHRDFKPENVLCGDDGRVRVTDFGLVRGDIQAANDRVSGPQLTPRRHAPLTGSAVALATRTGQLIGTPAYMAPEQLNGAPADARSDQFSFAVSLFEALYNVRPYPAKDILELSAKLASGQVSATPPDTKVPAALLPIVTRGLRPRPEDRFPSVQAMLDQLAPFRPKHSERSPRDARVRSLPATARSPRRKLAMVVFGIVAASVAIGAGAGWMKSRRADKASRSPNCGVETDGKLHCGNVANAAIHGEPSFGSAFVNGLRTTTSWFDCWTAGEATPNGSTTWYHTLGDDNATWGWVAASDVKTPSEFNKDPTAHGLSRCAGARPPLPANCNMRGDGKLYCENRPHTPVHESPKEESPVVNRLGAPSNWFKCWGTGEHHAGGNTTWYFTLGDDTGSWGWVPGVALMTPATLDADPSVYGLQHCD